MKNPHTIWAAVTVVALLIGASVTLALMDKDVTIILTLAGLVAVPVLGAFGAAVYQKLDQVRENSNGTMASFMDLHRQTQQQLTQLAFLVNSTPPASVSPEQGEGIEGLRHSS